MLKISNHAFKGCIFSILAYASYAFMDGTVKYGSIIAHFNTQVFYFYMNISSVILLFIFLCYSKDSLAQKLRIQYPMGLILRIILGVFTLNITFITIKYIPLDLYYSIIFLSPIIASALAIIFLKDALSVFKILIIIGGFIGILIVFSPWNNLAFRGLISLPVLGAFLAAIGSALIWIVTKKYLASDNIATILFYLFIASSIWSGAYLLITYHKIIIPSGYGLLLMFIASLFALGGFGFYTKAVQTTHIQFILPTEYTLIIFGTIFGIFIFNHQLNLSTIVGSLVIMATSVALLVYTSKQNRKNSNE